MRLMKIDPRALKDNPDRLRQTKSTPQADALLLATIKAVGIVQLPVVSPEADGGNGYIIHAGHSTAGHGGFHLSLDRNAQVHPMLRSEGGWYESHD